MSHDTYSHTTNGRRISKEGLDLGPVHAAKPGLPITAVWLRRCGERGESIEVLLEVNGQWSMAFSHYRSARFAIFSH